MKSAITLLLGAFLLVDGPHHVRPMTRADLEGVSVHAAEIYEDGGAVRRDRGPPWKRLPLPIEEPQVVKRASARATGFP